MWMVLNIRRLRGFICGSIAALRNCRMRRCWTAPSSGCSTNPRSVVDMNRADVIALAVKELAEFFPRAGEAKIEKAHVVKEVRATFSAKPGLEQLRPLSSTRIPNLFLAGDWTRCGWPATMEGAVRSGYLAAEAVTGAAGKPVKFLLPDIA